MLSDAAQPAPRRAGRGPAHRRRRARRCCWRAPATETLAAGDERARPALPRPARALGHRPAGGARRAGPGRRRPPRHQARQPRRPGGPRATGPSTWCCSTSPWPARAAGAVRAGTPPYLDPFLGTDGRDRYDSAAERYAAAVVLFEMATGAHARLRRRRCPTRRRSADEADDHSRPCSTRRSPTAMVDFFRRALARDVADRHHTAAEMLRGLAARSSGRPRPRTPDDAGRTHRRRDRRTPRSREAGLSARALSALEPLARADRRRPGRGRPGRLSRLGGVAEPTRKEVKERRQAVAEQFGAAVRRGRALAADCADARAARAAATRPTCCCRRRSRAAAAATGRRWLSLILGVTGGVGRVRHPGAAGRPAARAGQRGPGQPAARRAAGDLGRDEPTRELLDGLGARSTSG